MAFSVFLCDDIYSECIPSRAIRQERKEMTQRSPPDLKQKRGSVFFLLAWFCILPPPPPPVWLSELPSVCGVSCILHTSWCVLLMMYSLNKTQQISRVRGTGDGTYDVFGLVAVPQNLVAAARYKCLHLQVGNLPFYAFSQGDDGNPSPTTRFSR